MSSKGEAKEEDIGIPGGACGPKLGRPGRRFYNLGCSDGKAATAPMTPNDLRREATEVVADLRTALGFLTRIPQTWFGGSPERPDFGRATRVFPVVGAVVGIVGGLVLFAGQRIGMPPFLAAALAVLATFLLTGGLHEDGLADTADGLGGATREQKLAIMDDSRVGTYGAAAIAFSILIRTGALGGLAVISPVEAALALVGAEAFSRAAVVWLWRNLPPARPGGLARDTGPPTQAALIAALVGGVVIAAVAVWPAAGFNALVAGSLFSAIATYILREAALRAIGGFTGDVLGAAQQVAVIFFLIGVASFG